MNKGLLLLLVTVIQSQSNGVLLSGHSPNHSDAFDENFEEFQMDDWDNSEFPYATGISKEYNQKFQGYRKRSGNDVLTRRSILDKNFMRFGRNDDRKLNPEIRSGALSNRLNFLRFGRGMKDNFIRFGRGARDNFIRFGRGGEESFIRFGKSGSEDFLRPGKSERENFIRFGKPDRNFLRFGRGEPLFENDKKNPQAQNYFAHIEPTAGSSSDGYEKTGLQTSDGIFRENGEPTDGKNETHAYDVTGKDAREDVDNAENDETGLKQNKDVNLDVVIRIKRKTARNTTEINDEYAENSVENPTPPSPPRISDSEDSKISKIKRSPNFFARIPEYFPRKSSRVLSYKSWDNLENLKNFRLNPPFFPVTSKLHGNMLDPYLTDYLKTAESKRNQDPEFPIYETSLYGEGR